MKYIENIGLIATIFSILSFFPVVINIYKTKKTNNFPYKTIFLAICSHIFWLIYGLYNKTYANIIAASSFLVIYFFMLYIKLNYSK